MYAFIRVTKCKNSPTEESPDFFCLLAEVVECDLIDLWTSFSNFTVVSGWFNKWVDKAQLKSRTTKYLYTYDQHRM